MPPRQIPSFEATRLRHETQMSQASLNLAEKRIFPEYFEELSIQLFFGPIVEYSTIRER